MGYGDYDWALFREYYGDPFPHSLLSTRQYTSSRSQKTGNPIASILKSQEQGIQAPIVLNPVSNFFRFTVYYGASVKVEFQNTPDSSIDPKSKKFHAIAPANRRS